MSLCIIELNDSEIRVANGTNIMLRSPGIAVVNNGNVYIGEEALGQAYLNPRATYNRYWYKLNQDALLSPTGKFRHHADLAYAHLLSIYEQANKPEEIIFAVPGSYSRDQLALLLGIVESCPFKAAGLVDSAVAGAAAIAGRGVYQHIDMHLHQTVITTIEVNGEVERQSVDVIDDMGIASLFSTIAGLIADLFIKQSRFDPLHHAETEQTLYNQLSAWLKKLEKENEVICEIKYQNATHQAKLSRNTVLESLQKAYTNIINHLSGSLPCLISDRITILPGLTGQLNNTFILQPEAVFMGCKEHEKVIRSAGPALSFITSLPAIKSPKFEGSVPPVKNPVEKTSHVTHVLHLHQAYPLNEHPLYLSSAGEITNKQLQTSVCSVKLENNSAVVRPLPDREITINNQSVKNSMSVKPGDELAAMPGNKIFRFITVTE